VPVLRDDRLPIVEGIMQFVYLLDAKTYPINTRLEDA
jgi:hypothetical protein